MAVGNAGEAVVVFFRTGRGDAEASIPGQGWRDITSNQMLNDRITVLEATRTPWCWWADIGGPGAADNLVGDPVAAFGRQLY
jgi:hypothetical protein